MKRLLAVLLLALLSLPVIAQAQDAPTESGNTIAYGETVPGEISNRTFESVFTFEGQAGDVVTIQLTASEMASFDPYLYLTTLDNQVIAENDDFFDLNSRIVARLPETASYQIIATRLGERTGNGEGAFNLSLANVPVAEVGVTLEGTIKAESEPPLHVFAADTAGLYTVTYTVISGDYVASVRVEFLADEGGYTEEVASLNAKGLKGGSMTLPLETGGIYILSLGETYFNDLTAQSAVYTLRVDAVEEEAAEVEASATEAP
jgi:hypothetical protein